MNLSEGRAAGPRVEVGEGRKSLSLQWIAAFHHWDRSTRELMEAYESLRDQVARLTTTLEARNRALEESLKEEERLRELLSTILEALPVGVLVWDKGGNLLKMNSMGRKLLGLGGFGEACSLDDVESVCDLGEVLRELISCASRGQSSSRETSIASQNGAVRHLLLRSTPYGEPNGAPIGGVVTIEDITDLKNLQEEIARKQRLAAMGEMAANIVHEVRNPLGGIKLMASLMVEEERKETRAKISAQIEDALGSLEGLLKNLLHFARPIKPRTRPLDPMGVLSDCLNFIGPLAEQKKVRIWLEEKGLGCLVEADCELLKQAIFNILLNSLQAMPQGGEIRAWIDTAEEMAQKWVEIILEDTGTGIPSHVLPKVFDPFFTTRAEGSGLGLSIVHNIVVSHGGSVRIESEEGVGTRVKIRIPRAQKNTGELVP